VPRARHHPVGAAIVELRRGRGAVCGGSNAVGVSVQCDRGHRNDRQRRQPALQVGIVRIAIGKTETVTIAVDHDVDEIRPAPDGQITVAYPFSAAPTRHRVRLGDRVDVYAMCAIDALGANVASFLAGGIAAAFPQCIGEAYETAPVQNFSA